MPLSWGRHDEHALEMVDTRWTTLRHQLESLEVRPDLVEEIRQRMTAIPPLPGDVRRTMVLAEGRIVFDDLRIGAGTEPVTVDKAALPDLTPWLESRDAEVPFLLVHADRTGAEVDMFRAHGRPATEHRTVTGETFQITKIPEGDWAQAQYQRHAEGLWGRNAAEVTGAMTSIARRTRPATVLVAGDERAAELIEHDWNSQLGPLVKLDSGGRAPGTSEPSLHEEIEAVIAEFAAHADEDLAERLAEGHAHDWAATGVHDVLEALILGRVDTVALDPPRAAEVTVDPSMHPGLSLPEQAMVGDALPADRVVTALAACTGAAARVIDGSLLPRDGVSAVLRWSEDV